MSSAVPAYQEVLTAGLVEYWHSLLGEEAEGPGTLIQVSSPSFQSVVRSYQFSSNWV